VLSRTPGVRDRKGNHDVRVGVQHVVRRTRLPIGEVCDETRVFARFGDHTFESRGVRNGGTRSRDGDGRFSDGQGGLLRWDRIIESRGVRNGGTGSREGDGRFSDGHGWLFRWERRRPAIGRDLDFGAATRDDECES
ncbi:hypothetical protein THAOC_12436, partial [Thalassiosira oceanica]